MDVVYVFKEWGNDSFELRYSLRSLENLKYDNVYIIWGKPLWLQNVKHIKCPDNKSRRQLNVVDKIIMACTHPDISDNFILMNDDFFILQSVKKIPYYKLGRIQDHIEHRNAKWVNPKLWYSNHIKASYEQFKKWDDFEVHVPFVINKKKFLKLIDIYWRDTILPKRTLYCNHYKIKWKFLTNTPNYNWNTKIVDCKCYDPKTFSAHPKQRFLSIWDNIVNDSNFISYIKHKFLYPSKYENPNPSKRKKVYVTRKWLWRLKPLNT